MKLNFRKLRADEIDVRIGSTKSDKGTSLLLYKDARCDMNILDETVGAMNWQRHHTRENANCIVSIWDDEKSQWVSKEDTGTESFTEKEKGLASDSFKRACFNWGIGRELYTGGFIFIPVGTMSKDDIKYANFQVSTVTYDDAGNIKDLIIKVGKKVIFNKNKTVEEDNQEQSEPTTKKEPKNTKATKEQIDRFKELHSMDEITKAISFFKEKYKFKSLEDVDAIYIEKMIENKEKDAAV